MENFFLAQRLLATRLSRFGIGWYVVFVLAVAAASVVVKVSLAESVAVSALFSDDYHYLNQAIPGFEEGGGPTGGRFLYSYLVSAWKLADGFDRFQVVFRTNFLFDALFIVFSSALLWRLTGRRSLIAPLCLAALSVTTLTGFHALTENALYPVLAAVAWLHTSGPAAFRGGRFVALATLVAMSPLIRLPGIAVALGSLAALAVCARELGPVTTLRRAVALIVAAVGPYLVVSFSPIGRGGRESVYIELFGSVESLDAGLALLPLTLLAGQLGYLLLATGAWGLPLAVAGLMRAALPHRHGDGRLGLGHAAAAGFLAVTAGGFLAAAVFHLVARQIGGRPDGPFFFIGRYLDPVVVLVMIAALAVVLRNERSERPLRWLAIVLVPVAAISVLVALDDVRWRPSVHNGLALVGEGPDEYLTPFLAAILAGVLYNAIPVDRVRRAAGSLLLICWIAVQWAGVDVGHEYVVRRAAVVARGLEAGGWLAAQSPPSAVVCLDQAVADQRAPDSLKEMQSVFLGMRFLLYPRPVEHLRSPAEPCDYFFSLAPEGGAGGGAGGAEPVWQRGRYVVFSRARGLPVQPPPAPHSAAASAANP